jgi:hypothetical protein
MCFSIGGNIVRPISWLKHLKTLATIIANDVELTKIFAKACGDGDVTDGA